MEILKVNGLTKSYGSEKTKNLHVVLDNLSFTVEEGTFVGFIGENGYGKSTLMHLLGGLDKVTSGSIIVGETEIANMIMDEATEFRRKNIGVVYQFFNLIPSLTVEQNITFTSILKGENLDLKFYTEIIDYLNLKNIQNRYPKELGAFEQQLVALARALLVRPKFILLDEPTGNLSMKEQDLFMNVLKKVQTQFKQTLIIFSNSKKVFAYCDKTYRLIDGKFEGSGM